MDKTSRLALILAIAGLACNLFMINISGVCLSIPLGIFGIALAILGKDEDGKHLSTKAKTALILSIVALVFGLLIFAVTVITTDAMADPEISRSVIDTVRSVKDQLPEDMQEMFEQAGIPLE